MEEKHLDLVVVPLSLLVVATYHSWLLFTIIRNPKSTVIGLNALARKRWVDTMMADPIKNGVLAVQTLRNNIMASTVLATTAITLASASASSPFSSSSSLVYGNKTTIVASVKFFAISPLLHPRLRLQRPVHPPQRPRQLPTLHPGVRRRLHVLRGEELEPWELLLVAWVEGLLLVLPSLSSCGSSGPFRCWCLALSCVAFCTSWTPPRSTREGFTILVIEMILILQLLLLLLLLLLRRMFDVLSSKVR